MLTRIEDNTNYARTSTDIIFQCIETVMHVTEYGRRETLLQCCFNAGPSSSMAASVCVSFTFIPRDDKLLNPASFSKSITLRV